MQLAGDVGLVRSTDPPDLYLYSVPMLACLYGVVLAIIDP